MNMNNLKSTFYIITFLLFAHSSYAQIGARLGYNFNNYGKWEKLEEFTTNNKFHKTGVELGINAEYRLPKVGIKFLPEIAIGTQIGTNVEYISKTYDLDHKYLDLRLNTHFYIFDFYKSCDCPTFEQKKSLGSRFFVSLAPGVRFAKKSVNNNSYNNIVGNVTLGLGYDIPINESLMVTPHFGYRLNIGDKWGHNIFNTLEIENEGIWHNTGLSIMMSYNLKQKRQKGLFKK